MAEPSRFFLHQDPPAPLIHFLSLLALSGLFLLVNLDGVGLTDRDEGSNAEAAREMLETGDWISPTLNYEPRFAKPAFVYWLIGASYSVFGVNEFAARLPSALFGIALTLLQYAFLRRVCHSTIALLGSLTLLLNIEMIAINRMVLTDPELVFFTTLAGYSFWLGMQKEVGGRRFFGGFYLGMALATLAKGPVGIIIPLLGMVPYLTVTRQWREFWRIGFPLLGPLAVVVIAAPWYAAMFAIHGMDYVAAAQANTTGRFANPMEGHGGTVLFYIPIVLLGFFPWSGFLPVALLHAYRACKQQGRDFVREDKEMSVTVFSALWIVSVFVFFTMSATRLPHYIYPIFPASATIVVLWWSRHLSESWPPGYVASIRLMVILGYLLGFGFALAPGIFEAVVDTIAREFPGAKEVQFGLLPILLGVLVLAGTTAARQLAYSEHRRGRAFWVAGGMMGALALTLILFGLPLFSRYFIAPPQELAAIAGYNLAAEDRLIQFGRKRPSLAFYARRKVIQINPGEDDKFSPYLTAPGRTMIVLQSHLRDRLPLPVRDYSLLLERHGFSLLSSESFLK